MNLLPDTYVLAEDQMLLFLGACLLGVPSGLLFDVTRLLRRLLPHHNSVVLLEDVLAITGIALLLLFYTHAFAHQIFRFYYAAGCILGLIVYEYTVGTPLLRLLDVMLRLAAKPLRWIALICRKAGSRFVGSYKK